MNIQRASKLSRSSSNRYTYQLYWLSTRDMQIKFTSTKKRSLHPPLLDQESQIVIQTNEDRELQLLGNGNSWILSQFICGVLSGIFYQFVINVSLIYIVSPRKSNQQTQDPIMGLLQNYNLDVLAITIISCAGFFYISHFIFGVYKKHDGKYDSFLTGYMVSGDSQRQI